MPKRTRAANFTRQDIDILLNLVEEIKDVLENKTSDASIWKEKNEGWKNLSRFYNAQTLQHRSAKELKAKFDGLKKMARNQARKKIASEGSGLFETATTSVEDSLVLQRVRTLIKMSADRLPTGCDSDHMELSHLKNEYSTTMDQPEEISDSEDIRDGVVMEEDNEIELENPEKTPAELSTWAHSTPQMHQIPSIAALAENPAPDAQTAPSSEPVPDANPAPNAKSVPGAKPALSPNGNQRSRQRPVMRHKKTSTLSSLKDKLVTLAAAKTELARVKFEVAVAKIADAQRREEELHSLNIQILELELKRKIILLKHEEEKLKRMKEGYE